MSYMFYSATRPADCQTRPGGVGGLFSEIVMNILCILYIIIDNRDGNHSVGVGDGDSLNQQCSRERPGPTERFKTKQKCEMYCTLEQIISCSKLQKKNDEAAFDWTECDNSLFFFVSFFNTLNHFL